MTQRAVIGEVRVPPDLPARPEQPSGSHPPRPRAAEHIQPTLFAEPSLDACDHFHRFPEDIRMLGARAPPLFAGRYAAEHVRVPIYITENGVSTENDTRRIEYIERALAGVLKCLERGIDVRGYIHWSPAG